MKKNLIVEGTAKNINDAIEKAVASALTELDLPREQVTYELVENKKQGLFGLGGVWVKLNVAYEVEDDVNGKTRSFITGLLDLMKLRADVDVSGDSDGSVKVKLTGDDMALIIGHRGETLDAIQYIAGLVANKDAEEYHRVVIDSENYREKREEALKTLANKIADKVLKNQRSMTLEPMTPQERRVIHASLQNRAGVTTFSVGEDPNRKVVVAPVGPDGKPLRRPRPTGPRTGSPKPGAGQPQANRTDAKNQEKKPADADGAAPAATDKPAEGRPAYGGDNRPRHRSHHSHRGHKPAAQGTAPEKTAADAE